jgi:F420-dependent oxidoreductase-like protein
MAVNLGLMLPYTQYNDRDALVAVARLGESLGYVSVWVSELYSFDAFTTLTHLACHTERIKLGTNIANIYARTPSMLASTAASLDQISNGRHILGIGVSGPQVIEGWHGVAYDRPVQRTAETIEIVRTILAGDRLAYEGEVFRVTQGLKIMNKPLRPDVPIYVAALGPKNVEMTAAVADGWLPTFYSPAHAESTFGPALAAGRARRSPALGPLDVAPFVPVGTDPETGRNTARWVLGFYIGGMGSRERNFYKDLVTRYGFGEAAQKIQDLFLGGDKQAAFAAVPDELIDAISIFGDEAQMRDRLAEFEASGATPCAARWKRSRRRTPSARRASGTARAAAGPSRRSRTARSRGRGRRGRAASRRGARAAPRSPSARSA